MEARYIESARARSSIFAAYNEQRNVDGTMRPEFPRNSLQIEGTWHKSDLTGTGAGKPLGNKHETSFGIFFNVWKKKKERRKEEKKGERKGAKGRKRKEETLRLSVSSPFVNGVSVRTRWFSPVRRGIAKVLTSNLCATMTRSTASLLYDSAWMRKYEIILLYFPQIYTIQSTMVRGT